MIQSRGVETSRDRVQRSTHGRVRRHALALAAAALTLVAIAAGAVAAGAATNAAPTMNVVQAAAANTDLTTFSAMLKTSGLDKTLAGSGPFTVFAPNDAAFAQLPTSTLDELQSDPHLLASVLRYDVVAGDIMSAAAKTMSSATTMTGARVGLSVVGDSLYVGDAKVVTPDVAATNGVLHVVDTVLMPPSEPDVTGNRAAYCAVAGDTTPAGKPIPAGRFLNLDLGQPGWDYHYVGAKLAAYIYGRGLTCAAPPAGYKLRGTAPDELHVPGKLYLYYSK
jgi:uncharacterized surface protein with fasciclin (FAS1) repeats